ncbi:MAG: hypothetical protein E7661_03080 [Ruminococcaceae bacterium]|nr:hypothetical protein [Oscillospiraceae bacterium]
MASYIYTWITVAFLAALAELMAPGGPGGKLTGHLRFVAGLCVLLALLPAVREGVAKLQDLADNAYDLSVSEDAEKDYQQQFQASLTDMTADACESWVMTALETYFSISKDKCRVSVSVILDHNDTPSLSSVEICLLEEAILKNPHSIEKYITGQLSVPCTVRVELT